MMRNAILPLLFVSTIAFAGDTEAEKLYRDAWWRESSQSDIPKALEAYRKAAEAKGPAAVQARSLLKVAEMLKRLGRTEEAIKTLEDVRRRFPGEKAVLATAAERAKEWTAVDLRKSYSDWYRRYLFSPEFQTQVVERVLNLPGEGGAEWLLAIGEAAVPALREAVKSKNPELVTEAMNLLLQLEEMPPARVLLDERKWAEDEKSWQSILRASKVSRDRVRREANGAAPLAKLLAAAATSPTALIKALAGDAGATLSVEHGEIVFAVLKALHGTGDPLVQSGVADLAVHPKSPRSLRPIAAELLLQKGWLGASGMDWLEWARDAELFEYRKQGMGWAGRVARPDDGKTIDAVLDELEEVGKVREELRFALAASWAEGLGLNGMAFQLAWTPERLRRYFRVCLSDEGEEQAMQFLRALRDDRGRGVNVAHAILDAPETFKFSEDDGFGLVESVYYFESDDPDDALAAARWGRWVQRAILRRWDNWNQEQRGTILHMAVRGLLASPAATRSLGKALTEKTAEKPVHVELAARIKKLREWSDDC